MTKRILIALAALTVLTLSFSSCKKDDKKPGGEDIKLAVQPQELKVMVGKTATLRIIISPNDAKYSLKSANTDIATVDEKGVVTGVAPGETVITVTAGNVEKTAKVTVTPLVKISDDQYIGLYPEDHALHKLIPAIYITSKDEVKKENQLLFVEAMTSKGWEFSSYTNDKDSNIAFLFVTPDDKQKDWRMASFAYYHNPSDGNKFMLGTQGAYKIDPLVEEVSGDVKELQEMILAVAKAYGFTENFSFAKIGKQELNGFVCYNLSKEGSPLELLGYSEKEKLKTGEEAFVISFQITWEGPEKPETLSDPTVIRSHFEHPINLSSLLKK